MTFIHIPYIKQVLDIEIPAENLAFDIRPQAIKPATNPAETVQDALDHPIGMLPLRNMILPGQKILIISDDYTRPTPVRVLLHVLLDTLTQAGVRDSEIKLIIASGTHRVMSPAEVENKYGKSILSRIEVITHACEDHKAVVNLGYTKHGIPILINRHFMDADFSIAVGNITPHYPAGWSGGAKAILPGIAHKDAIALFHLLGASSGSLGEVNTVMRQEMEEVAEKIGLNFILNVVLNWDGELLFSVAGHFIDAHRAGVEFAQKVYGFPVHTKADLTISSTSPVDFDFFQGDKGIFSAALVTQQDGEIVLVSGCLEGINPSYPDLDKILGRLENKQIWDELHSGKMADVLLASEAISINNAKGAHKITIVSQATNASQFKKMGFQHLCPGELAEYVRERLIQYPRLKVGVLRNSAVVYPRYLS